MIMLTTNAVTAVKAAMLQSAAAPAGLRVLAEADVAGRVRYALRLESIAREGDTVTDQSGVAVFMDTRSRAVAGDLRIDFVVSPEAASFVCDDGSHVWN